MERKIKDKRLRLAIEESAEQGIICLNVLICCIASLNEHINRSTQNQTAYLQMRNYLAKQALQLPHIDKKELHVKIHRLSPECCPSLKASGRIADMLSDKSREKTIDNSFVPDKLMRYLTDDEAREFHVGQDSRPKKPEEKLEPFIADNDDFKEICSIIENDFDMDLTVKMKKETAALMRGEYDFSIILKAACFSKREIINLLHKKEFNSTYSKFRYLLTIIESRLQETLERVKQEQERQKRFEDELTEIFARHNTETAGYQRKK